MSYNTQLQSNNADLQDILEAVQELPEEKVFTHCWEGKRAVFLGDSIAQGYTDRGNVQDPYPKIVASNLGMTLTNYGIGGSAVAQQENYGGAFATQAEFDAAEKETSKIYQVITGQGQKTYEYKSGAWVSSGVNVRTPMSARWSFMRDDADLIVVQGGTNDFQYNWTPVGTMADRTPYTFYGALHTLFVGLLGKYKGKTIVFVTPLKRAQEPYNAPDSKNDNGLSLLEYRDAMMEVCDYYSIPVIDAFFISGLNPHVETQADLFDNSKTHPLQWGHKRLGDIVATQLLGIRVFDAAGPIDDGEDGGDTEEPASVAWSENTALTSGAASNGYVQPMNYRTTSDFVEVPGTGLTITLMDDDIEMCVYTFSATKSLISAMGSYLTARYYTVAGGSSVGYVKVMVRSKSKPNALLITAEQASAGVVFIAY